MAQVDLYGGDAQRIRDAYKPFRPQGPSDDEVTGWLSGQYGGGGINEWVNQIGGSGEATEARTRLVGQSNPNVSTPQTPPATTPPQTTPAGGNLDFWSGKGVPQSDIFDQATGQLKSGWARTQQGYDRTTPSAPQGGDLQAWIRSMLNGASSPQALAALEPQLSQRGVRLQKDSAGNVRGRLYLPDGSTVDVVNQWGQPWTWADRGAGAGGVGGGQLPSDQYSDAYSQLLEQLLKSRIGNLQGGYDDAMRQQYMQAMQQRANSLGQGNKQLDQLMGYLQERFTDLKGPGRTGAENEVVRTGALDPIEQDRSAAKKRVIERLSAMGHTLESGVAQQALQEVDKAFDAERGTAQTQLTGNELARREDRNQRAEMIGAEIADIPDQRAREQLDVFSALERLSMLARNEDESRSREAISYGGVLSDMGPQRLQLAMQAAGMGGNPSALGSMLTQIAGLNQNANQFNQQNSYGWADAMGTIMAIIQRSNRSGVSGAGI